MQGSGHMLAGVLHFLYLYLRKQCHGMNSQGMHLQYSQPECNIDASLEYCHDASLDDIRVWKGTNLDILLFSLD